MNSMSTEIKWVFFDIGSTLVDESRCYEDRFRRVAETAGVSYEYVKERAREFYGQNKKGDAEVIRLFGVPKPRWKTEAEFPYPEAAACLKALHGKYRLGIIANQSPGSEARLEAYGLRQHLDLVIASAEEGVEKPDPRIFQIALERAGCAPEEAMMVGDRIDNDIAPAKRAGMKTAWILQGGGRYWRVGGGAEQPDLTVDSLTALAAALL